MRIELFQNMFCQERKHSEFSTVEGGSLDSNPTSRDSLYLMSNNSFDRIQIVHLAMHFVS